MKTHNFYAGPSILPEEAIQATIAALENFAETGVSLASISHRSKEFDAVLNEAQELFKELLNIPQGYSVLFLGGGASMQFAMVPFNLLQNKAAYINTGRWSDLAIKEAKLFGEVHEVKGEDWFSIPKDYEIPSDVDYVHITSNNTVMGTQFHEDLDFGKPLVADMSSDIFSRPIDVSKYAIMYGGAQKNLAPAGLAFVIIKNDILGKVDRVIPSMFKYQTHIDKNSTFNTPPVVPIFTALQTLKWIKANGGVAGMAERNQKKADLLYAEIDSNPLFKGTVSKEDRSLMNACFVMAEEFKPLEADFMAFAKENGIVGIKGHRSVGGFRASLYNALGISSVEALVNCMKAFAKQHSEAAPSL